MSRSRLCWGFLEFYFQRLFWCFFSHQDNPLFCTTTVGFTYLVVNFLDIFNIWTSFLGINNLTEFWCLLGLSRKMKYLIQMIVLDCNDCVPVVIWRIEREAGLESSGQHKGCNAERSETEYGIKSISGIRTRTELMKEIVLVHKNGMSQHFHNITFM